MTSSLPILFYCQLLSLLLLIRHCHAWSSNSPVAHDVTDVKRTMLMSMTTTSSPFEYPSSRRSFVHAGVASAAGLLYLLDTRPVLAADDESADTNMAVLEQQQQQQEVQVQLTGEAKKLFNEGRTLEGQGNMAAAQRLYTKVTRMEPRFVYGWSNLGNTQTAFGYLQAAEESYTKSIQLCQENLKQSLESATGMMGVRRCNDLYILFLNRGTIRLNNGMKELALQDLTQSNFLRGRPDAIILQNLARAEELNGQYNRADKDYTVSISMTSNEVNPFWLRSAMVKYQLGDVQGAMDLIKRVAVRFPEAPEVRAAYGVLLAAQGDAVAGQRKYLEIPDRQRANYVDSNYLDKTIAWSPAMQSGLAKITNAVGDNARFKNGM